MPPGAVRGGAFHDYDESRHRNPVDHSRARASDPLFRARVAEGDRSEGDDQREAHRGDFDYLVGDWEFTSDNEQYGRGKGYWTAGGPILDEYRVVGDSGETYYVTRTLRAYNARLDQWELVSTEDGSGLQNLGTGHRRGAEMHIEQKFGAEREAIDLANPVLRHSAGSIFLERRPFD